MASTLGADNPLRYRGYVYDTETGLYYLQSRYYNPEWGRFINADAFVTTGQGFVGNNMFAYCLNNPVCRKDIPGTTSVEIFGDGDSNILDDDKTFSGTNMSNDSFGGSGGIGGNSGSHTPSNGDKATGYVYSTPPGGGGTTNTIQVGKTSVSFGHGGGHMDFSDISGLESAIANDVVTRPPTTGKFLPVGISYGGADFTYRYFTLSSTRINVGTYFYTDKK